MPKKKSLRKLVTVGLTIGEDQKKLLLAFAKEHKCASMSETMRLIMDEPELLALFRAGEGK